MHEIIYTNAESENIDKKRKILLWKCKIQLHRIDKIVGVAGGLLM